MRLTIKKYFSILKLSIYLVVPVVLLILPATFFDNGKSICLSRLLFNMECPGCGSVRAFMHIIHFDFTTAYHYNKLSFITFPLLSFGLITEIIKEWKFLKKKNIITVANS